MTKNMKSLTKVLLATFLAGLLVPGVYAANPSSGATVKPRAWKKNSAGVEMLPGNKAYKVWEVHNTTSASLVLDEGGTAPTSGTLHKVCGSSGTATSETFVVFDASATLMSPALSIGVADRALMPPVNRATATERCLEVNAQFHRGLVGLNSAASGRTYIYWSPNGGDH